MVTIGSKKLMILLFSFVIYLIHVKFVGIYYLGLSGERSLPFGLLVMIEEKAFVDFIITGVLILSFYGFYLYKMCIMRQLHKSI